MATIHESGRAVNASNYVERINIIERRKLEYSPGNPAITLETLLPQKSLVLQALKEVSEATEAKTAAVNSRTAVYEEMEKRVKRSIDMLSSTQASEAEINRGKVLQKKFKSIRISEKKGEAEIKAKAALAGTPPVTPKKISNSQQGFINRLAHFRDIINFLSTVTAYAPKEADLKISALEAIATSADELNLDRNKKADLLSDAIAKREKIMNTEPNGAYYISKKIMFYVGASHGKTSPFYQELKKYPVRK